LFAEIMGLKNVTELAYCRLIGRGFPAEVDTDKVTHGAGIVDALDKRDLLSHRVRARG